MRNLLDQIQCEDTDLKLAVSEARQSEEKKANFESTALHIIPKCPVIRKCMTKTSNTKKAETSAAASDDPAPKKGFGETGVALQYHSESSKRNFVNDKKPMGPRMATRARPTTTTTMRACQSKPQRS